MAWPDTKDNFGDHVMESLGEILGWAAHDPDLSPRDRVKLARLVGLTLLRAYADHQSDRVHADRVGNAWVNAQLGWWDYCANELNHAGLGGDASLPPPRD